MAENRRVANHVARVLDWGHAHVDFNTVVAKIPAEARGLKPPGVPYSPWQLLEHMRLAQRDILDYCRDSEYQEMDWPDDYWPRDPAPPTAAAWDESVAAFRTDLDDLKKLATDPGTDLLSAVPNASDVTYLRELLLVADHNAYHLGQLVLVLRLLGVWEA